jgi:hypothetical protein
MAGGDYDLSWWRRCENDMLLRNVDIDVVNSETMTDDIRTVPPLDNGDDSSRENVGVSSGEDGGDETYGLICNDIGRAVWGCYERSLLTGVGKGDEGNDEEDALEVEWSITAIAKMDAWVMTVVDCLSCEAPKGGGRQKEYASKFEVYLPMAMRQISRSLFSFVQKWEPNDLTVWFGDMEGRDVGRQETLAHIFRRPFAATVPIYNEEEDKVYLTIEPTWFVEYVEKEVGRVLDAFVAVLNERMDRFVPI